MRKRIEIVVTIIIALMAGSLCGVSSAPAPLIKKAPTKKPVKVVPHQLANPILKIEMISIHAGSFLMGNSGLGNDEAYRSSCPNELPQHSVTLAAYTIGKYEVTRGQYRQFIKAGGYTNSANWSVAGWSWKVEQNHTEPAYWAPEQEWVSGSKFTQTDNHPVVGVDYYEAEAFCKWAGGHLPTEAQWERAARWNPTTNHANVYPWGDVWDVEKSNTWNDTNVAGGGYQRYQTAPVGSYPNGASPSGCQDMAGNAWEWCQDWFHPTYYATSPSIDPKGPTSGISRVLRGGGWDGAGDFFKLSRCASRFSVHYAPSYSGNFGFRLAR